MFERCFCCMGLGDFGFKVAHSKRTVAWRGRSLTHYFCQEHCDRGAQSLELPKEPQELTPRLMYEKVRRAIAVLDTLDRSYDCKEVCRKAGLYWQRLQECPGIEEVITTATAASRERQLEKRIRLAIESLNGPLRVMQILDEAQMAHDCYKRRPNLVAIVERAVLASGGKLKANRGNAGQKRRAA